MFKWNFLCIGFCLLSPVLLLGTTEQSLVHPPYTKELYSVLVSLADHSHLRLPGISKSYHKIINQ